MYLKTHSEIEYTSKTYQLIQEAGQRNPLSDHDFVIEKQVCPQYLYNKAVYRHVCKTIIKAIRTNNESILTNNWSQNINYDRIVTEEKENIKFPANRSTYMAGLKTFKLQSASEGQFQKNNWTEKLLRKP